MVLCTRLSEQHKKSKALRLVFKVGLINRMKGSKKT